MKHQTARLSVDLPLEQHMHLKMQAAKRGLTMREYILTALMHEEERNTTDATDEISPESFRKGLDKLRKEKHHLARNLSKR